jgi:hypothetical protein
MAEQLHNLVAGDVYRTPRVSGVAVLIFLLTFLFFLIVFVLIVFPFLVLVIVIAIIIRVFEGELDST